MVEVKQLSGFLNTDDSNEVLGYTHHKIGRNIIFRGVQNKMRVENISGTTHISNNLPAGTNECIGAFYDELKQRIFWFNYNSNNNHGIYQYTISTGIIAPIVISNTNTDGDILNFTLNGFIYAVKMLYGDITQGDTLYFNNSQKQPCQININRAIAGGYGTIERSYINVIKAPSIMPPAVVYQDDNTVTVNNLRKKLFKFKIRYVYSNKDKSVWSSISILPLPVNYTDTLVDKDPTKNCRIALVIPTGAADVVKIEIAATQSLGNVFSDFFLVQVLDKTANSIPSNDITTFRFYNDQAYVPIDLTESVQLFDLVPLQANDLEFLNGNVPIYGGILEGYDLIPITGSVTATNEQSQDTQPPFLFVGSQSEDSGFGTGNIHIAIIGIVRNGEDTFNIYTTNNTISFPAAATTTASIITGLAAAAVSAGFTVVSSDTENLIIAKTGESLQRVGYVFVPILPSLTDTFVYDWNANYAYGVVYFDKNGITNGVITNISMSVSTVNYTITGSPFFVSNIPKQQFQISSRPPNWAYYFQIVRTNNLSKSKFLYWVSFITYKDADYAYINIENLNTYIKDNPSSNFLAYDFSTGDRIRFLRVLSGNVNTIYTNNDFSIQSQLINPTINGTVQQGQFLKIALPVTSSTFDFGTKDFYNYFIQLYTPAQSAATGLNSYFEFGERYTIGNPTLFTRYHQGMLQNQTPNLSQPATFEFTQGDDYYRNRTINGGNYAEWNITSQTSTVGGKFYPAAALGFNTIDPNSYSVQSTTAFNVLSTVQNANWAIFKDDITQADDFTAKGTIIFKSNINATDVDFGIEIYDGLGTNPSFSIQLGIINSVVANVTYTITINTNFTFLSNYNRGYFFIGANSGGSGFKGTVSGGISLNQTASIFNVAIIDRNFSDFFQSAVNSNGREWIVDPNAAQVFNPTLLRWGLAYQPDTNINQSNRFQPLNFDEIDRSKGQIQRLKARERICRVFQERACGQMGVYAKFIQGSSGTNILTTTNDIITKNNVQYYEGTYGIGNQPTSLVSGKIQDYFVDPVRAYQMRLSGDGLVPISELYKGQFFIQPLFPPYNKNYLRLNGSKAKILGCYDFFEEQYITILQGGTLNGNTILDYAFSFNEKRNAYCCFYDFNPEMIISAEDIIYSWKNGQLYVHNNKDKYCNFYGSQFYPSLTMTYNKTIEIKKKYLALGYQSNQIWESPVNADINTSFINPQTGLQQISQLINQDFVLEENIRTAAFLFDANSMQNAREALVNGDYLQGNWLEIKLVYLGSDFAWIFEPYITHIVSPRNF